MEIVLTVEIYRIDMRVYDKGISIVILVWLIIYSFIYLFSSNEEVKQKEIEAYAKTQYYMALDEYYWSVDSSYIGVDSLAQLQDTTGFR